MTIFNASCNANPAVFVTPTGQSMAWTLAFLLTLLPLFAFAHDGEDHGAEARTPVILPGSAARMELKSPDVELLGILMDGKLTLYADRYASNEPIRHARIELESNGQKTQAQETGDGRYLATADWLKHPGKLAVVVSIEADGLEDLLAGELVIPAPDIKVRELVWLDYAKWASAGAAALLLSMLFIRRRNRIAAATFPCLLAVLMLGWHIAPGYAHGGEDHGDKPKSAANVSASGSLPAVGQVASVRLPDGSVFVPKPVQQLLGIRTKLAETSDIVRTIALNGQVSADPNFSGRVQSSQSGHIAAPHGSFPTLGMKVAKGQVLAYIDPALSNIDKGNQQAQLAELTSNLDLATKRVQRLEQLAGSVPQKEIDAARSDEASLKARRAAVSASLFQREALRAPVSGMVSRADVVAGQLVEAREVLFEVIDPSRLRVEAIAFDTALFGQVGSVSAMTANNQPLALTFIGQSYQLREQGLPMQFAVKTATPMLSVGQPVKVLVQTRQSLRGISVPQGSVLKNSNGDSVVWLHESAERFVPRQVKVQALDDAAVAVLDGLHDGERVVTHGADLLAQIR